jgi:hypothetical protein
MTGTLFNSTFENALRIIVLLNNIDMPVSIERICALDFMSQYSRVFHLTDYNLQGENPYKFSEYLAKRQFVTEAVKYLVLRGLVCPMNLSKGLQYSITPQGEDFCESLYSTYAEEYDRVSKIVVTKTSRMTDEDIVTIIEKTDSDSTGE